MRQVNDHAQSVHLVDQEAAVLAEAAPVSRGLVERVGPERRIGVLVSAVVRQSRIAHAQRMVGPQIGDPVSDLVKALDAQGRDELALLERSQSVAAVQVRREVIGVRKLQPVDQINLLEGILDGFGTRLELAWTLMRNYQKGTAGN